MKTFKRIFVGMLILLVVLFIAGFFFMRHITHRSLPDYNSDLNLEGLHASVDVYRDSYAIPHVYAQDEHDLYMAVGYLIAEDRLWQMDMLRRVTEGRLSELFGEKYVETDLLLRALRFNKKSEKILASADSASIMALEAFSEGINQFIENNKNKLPPEFAILRYRPERWKPYQSLNMIGYMAWDLKAGWSEILLSNIRETVDSIRYKQILPDRNRMLPTVYPVDDPKGFSSLLPLQLLNTAQLQRFGADVLDGSNNWAVSGSRSSTGKPLLANDMHLGLSIPGIWYQIHQVVPGKLNVTGLLLPGAPVIVCGHNDSIAWGMTNTYVDNIDFYEEKINPSNPDLYEYKGEWKAFELVKTKIRLSNGDEVERTLRYSHRGPVVSSFKNIDAKVVTMHWVGDEPSDEFRAIMNLNRANNWNDFKNALKTFTSISQNIAYADVKGNIGLFCAAGIPIRNRRIPFGILPGCTDEFDWKGYVPFDELPCIFNPVIGYVASANNKTVPRDYPYHIGTWYSLPNRYQRITEMISAKEVLSVEDFVTIQLDQKSKLAEKYMPSILNALAKPGNMGKVESNAIDLLKEWKYGMKSTDPAALIFEMLYLQFIQCTFSDELGSDLFAGLNVVTSITRTATDQMMDSKNSLWFDDLKSKDRVEQFDDMVICAFRKTMAELSDKLGPDPALWEWGKMHTIELTHPMATVKILDRLFNLNRGPYAVGGSFHTVSPYSYSSNEPFKVSHGSSHRHIYDLSNWDNSLTVIPTGISGIPASEHYCDQTDLYIRGAYHPDYFSKENIIEYAHYHMTFTPK